jgi:hypothetical protein
MKGRYLTIVFCLFLTITIFQAIAFARESEGKATEVEKTRITQKMLTLRVPFIENRGQTDSRVKYYAKTFAGTVLVTDEGKIVYSLPVKEKGRQIALAEKLLEARVRAVQGREKSVTKVNYFVGNDSNKWKPDLSAYDLVSLGEVYRGIELKLYAHGNNVEKLFYVRPQADPRNIKLAIAGAKKITTNKDGNLVVGTNLGEVRFSKPVAYQEIDGNRKVVEAAYVVCGKGYGFSVGDYDMTKDLVIDPTLLYSTFLGGGSYDNGSSVAVDSSGNAYVTGNTNSTNFPTTAGAYQTTNAGGYDAFITKINAAGTALVYSTYLGGSTGDEYCNSIAVDSSGSAYVTGFTNSTDFPTTAGAFQTANLGSNDVFVTKINAAGNALIYSTYLGGTSIDQSNSIAVDSSGSAYVTGYTQSTDFPTTAGTYQTTSAGSNDVFVTKINTAGTSLVYSTYLGGSGSDQGLSMDVDSSGNAYVTGNTNSTDFPTTAGTYQTASAGSGDAFVTKINTAGTSLVYSTYLGGSGSDRGLSMAVDSSGSAYVTGDTSSSNFPTTAGAVQTTYAGHAGLNDAFVTKINAAGDALVYSTYLGGTDYDQGLSMAVDSSGNAYVAGYTQSSNFPTTPGAVQASFGGVGDAFVTKINAAGDAFVYSTYLGGTYSDSSHSIAVDTSGNAYVTGETNSTGFPTTAGAYQTTLAGSYNAFVTKIGEVVAAPSTPRTSTGATVPGSGGGGGCFISTAASGDAGH